MIDLASSVCPKCGGYPCVCGFFIKRDSEVVNFAKRIAAVFDYSRSSTVFFYLQQAYHKNEDWEWKDYQELLTRIANA